MNRKGKEHETPKNTNPIGGRVHGSKPGLGRETSIDELITRVDSNTRDLFW